MINKNNKKLEPSGFLPSKIILSSLVAALALKNQKKRLK
jgi:hypothetical protein